LHLDALQPLQLLAIIQHPATDHEAITGSLPVVNKAAQFRRPLGISFPRRLVEGVKQNKQPPFGQVAFQIGGQFRGGPVPGLLWPGPALADELYQRLARPKLAQAQQERQVAGQPGLIPGRGRELLGGHLAGQVFQSGGLAAAGVAQQNDGGVFVYPLPQRVQLHPVDLPLGLNPLAIISVRPLLSSPGGARLRR